MNEGSEPSIIRDLLFMDVLGAVLVLTVILIPGLKVLRILLGVPFVLFFPGYFLVSALFPRRDDLKGLERLALSLGLSLALVPLIGLVLNYTPFGIRLYPVAVSLYLFMLGMTGVTRLRRGVLDPKESFKIDLSSHLPSWDSMGVGDKALIFGSVVVVVGVGAGGAFLLPSHHGEEFTEFYILGSEGKMENYPTELEVGGTGTVIVGIKNHEYRTEDYSVILTLDNDPLKKIEDIRLDHEENWEDPVAFQVWDSGENMKLEFLLHMRGNAEPYRRLHLWLTVESAG